MATTTTTTTTTAALIATSNSNKRSDSSNTATTILRACDSTTHLTDLVATIVPSMWDRNRHNETHIVFKRFVYQVLKVMEASTNCVLVALLYIYRLYILYPGMETQAGFEVRTFTTALMLANKYLEDYTYKSKSWADVTGIHLNELNLMEGEFMSAIHYRLHVTKEQLSVWLNYCQSQVHVCYYCHNSLTPLHVNPTTTSFFLQNKQHQQPAVITPNNNDRRPVINELPKVQQMKTLNYSQHYHLTQITQQPQVTSSLLPYRSTTIPATKKRKRDEPLLPALTPLKRRNYNSIHTTTARHSYYHPPNTTTSTTTTAAERYVYLTSASNTVPGPYHHHHQQQVQQQHRFAIPIYP